MKTQKLVQQQYQELGSFYCSLSTKNNPNCDSSHCCDKNYGPATVIAEAHYCIRLNVFKNNTFIPIFCKSEKNNNGRFSFPGINIEQTSNNTSSIESVSAVNFGSDVRLHSTQLLCTLKKIHLKFLKLLAKSFLHSLLQLKNSKC